MENMTMFVLFVLFAAVFAWAAAAPNYLSQYGTPRMYLAWIISCKGVLR